MRFNTKKWRILNLLLLLPCVLAAQERFVTPISGAYGVDYIIVNYVDWGVDETILDAHCLSKTYDGHQGTDFVLRNFALMDTGIAVLAVDTGVVIFTQDGFFDREKSSDPAKGLGNYIGLTHSGGFQTYYGHLRKNSVLVSVGDTVLPGQQIGWVGSSGNSEDPHLHFELWYDSLFHIDPFSGSCGNAASFWKDELPVDSLFHQWISGMVGFIPDLDTLREEPFSRSDFDQQDEAIAYWTLIYGLREGDQLKVEWVNPDGLLWYVEDVVLDRDWWYYYFWSWIYVPAPAYEGGWTVRLLRNGELVEEKPFQLSAETSGTQAAGMRSVIQVTVTSGIIRITGRDVHGSHYQLVDVHGKVIDSGKMTGGSQVLATQRYISGMYMLHVIPATGEPQLFKVYIP